MNNIQRPALGSRHTVRRAARPRRGFTVVTAIMLIGFVGITVSSLTTLLVTQARRTRTMQVHGQLRQLLNVGAQAAVARLNQSGGHLPAAVPLPAALASAKLTLSSTHVTATSATVKVLATYQDLSHAQTLTLTNTNNHWQITTATLDH